MSGGNIKLEKIELNIDAFAKDGGYKIITSKENRERICANIQYYKNREINTFISCAQAFLNPQEAFDFILYLGTFNDPFVYNTASEILRKLAPQVDLSGIIDNFPFEDSIRRALILNSLPLPIEDDFIPFIFKGATSQLVINRCAFLNLVNRMKDQDPPVTPALHSMIQRTLDLLANDQAIPVLCTWFRPAFHYFKDNKRFSSLLTHIIHNGDPEVKASLGLHFAEAYSVTKEVTLLLSDKNPRVVAATIPSLSSLNLAEETVKPVFSNSSHIVRVLILRHFKTLPEYVVKEYMKDSSYEVKIDLIRFLNNYNKGLKHAKKIFSQPNVGQEPSWRISYEMLAMNENMLMDIGEDAFKFALAKADQHPIKLAKQAVEVLAMFAMIDQSYANRVDAYMQELLEKKTPYTTQVYNMLSKLKEAA
ncbi:hypothetical protein TRFO_07579 [Tritrichomonas foetus]|uniref:Uncharacterized protein n=1 Tax=Tritrichomonas foetus TaxID=1144522 RepID=A0A1J4JRH0_9EUKA|nr:hypothetical protein TRFO_07579 [Tritrichomonas foetus]|eukprot:OHT01346.1 hypothetical protein TRFO_07579 [Tritrichomonas foetus]